MSMSIVFNKKNFKPSLKDSEIYSLVHTKAILLCVRFNSEKLITFI